MSYKHHNSRAQSEKQCRRRDASSSQKTRRGIEGEKNGRRRYREVLLPERSSRRENDVRASFIIFFSSSKKPTRVSAPSPKASLGRRTVCGRTEQRRPPVSKRYETKVRMVWGSFLIAAAALKTPTRNGYNAQGVNLTFCGSLSSFYCPPHLQSLHYCNTTARLLRNIRPPPPTPRVNAIHHTILVMAIACKGKGAGALHPLQ